MVMIHFILNETKFPSTDKRHIGEYNGKM